MRPFFTSLPYSFGASVQAYLKADFLSVIFPFGEATSRASHMKHALYNKFSFPAQLTHATDTNRLGFPLHGCRSWCSQLDPGHDRWRRVRQRRRQPQQRAWRRQRRCKRSQDARLALWIDLSDVEPRCVSNEACTTKIGVSPAEEVTPPWDVDAATSAWARK